MELCPAQVRKLAILSQGIHKKPSHKNPSRAVLNVIEQLGYIQIDTISVVQRAHHHTLWNRVENYTLDQLDILLESKEVFEYWAHAAAYLPMRDFRYSLFRKNTIATGDKHWFPKDKKLTTEIKNRIRADGPLQARDFEHQNRNSNGWWDWKPAKKGLEQLFMEGELMVVKRQGFQKVYDLTERVLPAGLDTSCPSVSEYYNYLITSFLRANGPGRIDQISYLRKGMKTHVKTCCQEMLEDGRLILIKSGNNLYFALPGIEKQLEQKLSRSQVKILSPFDNLIIQRQRTRDLFNFDYSLECYVPSLKRKYGYFSLPLLWGQNFAGRMDVKVERKSGIMWIKNLHVETRKVDKFLLALKPCLAEFMTFNGASELQIEKISCQHGPKMRGSINRYKILLGA